MDIQEGSKLARPKVPIAKIQNTTTRHITYSKRRSGLLKKIYEVSVMSDIDCALIAFSTSDNLTQFSNRRIEDVLLKFLSLPEEQTMSSTPIPNKEDLIVLLENLKTQDMAREAPKQGSSTSDLPKSCWDSEDIQEEVIELQKRLNSLKNIQRFVSDLRKPIHSPLELKELDRKLFKILDQVRKRKNYLLSKSATSTDSSLPITEQYREEASFPLEQKLEALQLTNKGKQPIQPPYGGATGVVKKEKASDMNRHEFNTIDTNMHNSMDYASLSKEMNKLNCLG
ncbi:agamous-like MADS-box protein AGL14 [Carex littledalei]|uniref:Agamous-like MADS-box protein AGL14 n=1 Tax=Carex littledalei TaxID=544730 RepID=A0A833VVS4_9POAL|nr:agamous-like MADS-box protein AGL14 [Carex littledalei]